MLGHDIRCVVVICVFQCVRDLISSSSGLNWPHPRDGRSTIIYSELLQLIQTVLSQIITYKTFEETKEIVITEQGRFMVLPCDEVVHY